MSKDMLIRTTPLHQMHLDAGAKMVPFAGYDMPVSYPLGIKKEHNHTREKVGLFDVSHMGQIRLSGVNAKKALESIVPVDIIDLPLMKLRYALFTNKSGGVMDDLMVTNLGHEDLFLVVNAGCKNADFAHLQSTIGNDCKVEFLEDVALLALQGPSAHKVLSEIAPSISEMIFMTAKQVVINGIECLITRSGYTGEDGFEISLAAKDSEKLAKLLLSNLEVEWVGLGARDSLRLEAGLSLYGHELDIHHSPVESSLGWALSKVRRTGGEREGNYLGFETIMRHLNEGSESKVVGLQPEGRMPVRDGAMIEDELGNNVGKVTSGGFGPSINRPIAIARLKKSYIEKNSKLFALVRDKKIAVEIVSLPFVKQNYYRG
ncbi:glycine cleavage system aminomethyltransferase GcvT [Candidatus Thioglobus sp.]|nr:glycine cleavage system aminomethyltransferase GcvT [Candidatus Thioglobus sp.]MDA8981417.1 glycine cleavage system aminomethyltransferase GcvT [Candidatus Thioglobus sp.]MDB9975373.1 glycine cleavage system aminomethyltransferase GcvT [Candidatus Thioglobus sp.]